MNADSRSLLFYNATPRVEIDGTEDPMAASLFLAMEMTESEGGLSSIEVVFTNAAQTEGVGFEMPFETSTNRTLTLGKALRVVTGPFDDPQEVFQGRITGVELVLDGAKPAQLIVLAEDGLQTARLKRRSKVFAPGTLGDLVQAVAQESGLSVVAAELDMNLGTEFQANETDLGFLRRICARFDVDLQIVGTELHVTPRPLVDRGTLALEYGKTLTRFRGLADLAEQVSEVSLAGWDHATSTPFAVRSRTGAPRGSLTGRPASEFLAEAFAPRTEHIAEIAVTDQEQAQRIADAVHASRDRRFVSVEGAVTGNPALRVGTLIEITKVGPRFENTYYVTHAQHRFDREGGYFTDFRAECAYWGG